jgi:16S rRNA (uracil1498-N3)-methyltransferase
MRFFIDQTLRENTEILLSDDVAHHLIRVLRKEVGTLFTLFNGEGGAYKAELIGAGKKSAQARLLSFQPDNHESSLHTHLGQVMSKGERMDYAIQKAVELGVTEITPLTSERCELRLRGEERADKKREHWLRVAISACEQCGRNRLPLIHEPQTLNEWLAATRADLRLVLAPAQMGKLPQEPTPASVALLIGPEGGLSEQEIGQAKSQGFLPWQIGPRILRTETAPVAALALLQAAFGDFS